MTIFATIIRPPLIASNYQNFLEKGNNRSLKINIDLFNSVKAQNTLEQELHTASLANLITYNETLFYVAASFTQYVFANELQISHKILIEYFTTAKYCYRLIKEAIKRLPLPLLSPELNNQLVEAEFYMLRSEFYCARARLDNIASQITQHSFISSLQGIIAIFEKIEENVNIIFHTPETREVLGIDEMLYFLNIECQRAKNLLAHSLQPANLNSPGTVKRKEHANKKQPIFPTKLQKKETQEEAISSKKPEKNTYQSATPALNQFGLLSQKSTSPSTAPTPILVNTVTKDSDQCIQALKQWQSAYFDKKSELEKQKNKKPRSLEKVGHILLIIANNPPNNTLDSNLILHLAIGFLIKAAESNPESATSPKLEKAIKNLSIQYSSLLKSFFKFPEEPMKEDYLPNLIWNFKREDAAINIHGLSAEEAIQTLFTTLSQKLSFDDYLMVKERCIGSFESATHKIDNSQGAEISAKL